jgi:hypothetical protein
MFLTQLDGLSLKQKRLKLEMKGISTRRQVIVAAHSVFRGPLERLYDAGLGGSREWATSSPRPVNLPAPQSSSMDIVPWPLIFVLGIFALLTVLQQLLRDHEGGRQVEEPKEKSVRNLCIFL